MAILPEFDLLMALTSRWLVRLRMSQVRAYLKASKTCESMTARRFGSYEATC